MEARLTHAWGMDRPGDQEEETGAGAAYTEADRGAMRDARTAAREEGTLARVFDWEDMTMTPGAPEAACELDFAKAAPVIESGVANVKLGVFTRLFRRYEAAFGPERAAPLAYCVVRRAFLDPLNQPAMEQFARDNGSAIEDEVRRCLADQELSWAISLVFALGIMLLAWQTRNPFNEQASRLTQTLTDHSILLPHVVQMWGPDCIVNFFGYSQGFLADSLDPGRS